MSQFFVVEIYLSYYCIIYVRPWPSLFLREIVRFYLVYKSVDRVAEQLDTFTYIVHFLHIRAVASCNIAHSYFFCSISQHKCIFELWSFFLWSNVLYDVVKCISYIPTNAKKLIIIWNLNVDINLIFFKILNRWFS